MVFLYSHWNRLPLATRQAIAAAFGIAKTQSTHVSDNRIVADGYKIEDVENALTVERIQEYVGTKEKDMTTLFDLMVAKAEGKTAAPPVQVIAESATPIVEEKKIETAEVTPKKRGRPAKK